MELADEDALAESPGAGEGAGVAQGAAAPGEIAAEAAATPLVAGATPLRAGATPLATVLVAPPVPLTAAIPLAAAAGIGQGSSAATKATAFEGR